MGPPSGTNPSSRAVSGAWYVVAGIASIPINLNLAQVAAFKGALMALARAHIAETAVMEDGATAYMNAFSNVPMWGKVAVTIGVIAALVGVGVAGQSTQRGWLAGLVGILVGCIAGTLAGFLQGYYWHP